jgi:hypothetical protein
MHVALRQVILPDDRTQNSHKGKMFLKLDAVISVVPDSHGQPHGDPVGAFTE